MGLNGLQGRGSRLSGNVGLSRLFVSRPKKASLDTPLLLLLTTHTRSCLRPAFSTALTPARPEAGGAFARDAPPPDHRDPPALSDSVASRYYPLLSLCFSAPPPPVRPHDPRLVSTCCLSVPSACVGFAHHECPRRVCPCFGWVHVPWHGLSPSHVLTFRLWYIVFWGLFSLDLYLHFFFIQ